MKTQRTLVFLGVFVYTSHFWSSVILLGGRKKYCNQKHTACLSHFMQFISVSSIRRRSEADHGSHP